MALVITYTEDRIDFLVMREYPRQKSECTQTGPDVVWEPENDESKDGEI